VSVGAIGVVAACTTAFSTPRRAVRVHDITIREFRFQPDSIVVTRGDTVRWTNADPFEHTATAANAFDSDVLRKEDKAIYVAAATGRYRYRCSLHPTMEGTLIVR
jgi:plastocyanin